MKQLLSIVKWIGESKRNSYRKYIGNFYTDPKKMRTTNLEQLATKGVVTIQKKKENWLVECVRKDEAGFLVDRQMGWGRELKTVIKELLEKVRNAD